MKKCNADVWCSLDNVQKGYIIEALRRDMRREKELAVTDKEWSDMHSINARHSISLLEHLNPKHTNMDYEKSLKGMEVKKASIKE